MGINHLLPPIPSYSSLVLLIPPSYSWLSLPIAIYSHFILPELPGFSFTFDAIPTHSSFFLHIISPHWTIISSYFLFFPLLSSFFLLFPLLPPSSSFFVPIHLYSSLFILISPCSSINCPYSFLFLPFPLFHSLLFYTLPGIILANSLLFQLFLLIPTSSSSLFPLPLPPYSLIFLLLPPSSTTLFSLNPPYYKILTHSHSFTLILIVPPPPHLFFLFSSP